MMGVRLLLNLKLYHNHNTWIAMKSSDVDWPFAIYRVTVSNLCVYARVCVGVGVVDTIIVLDSGLM